MKGGLNQHHFHICTFFSVSSRVQPLALFRCEETLLYLVQRLDRRLWPELTLVLKRGFWITKVTSEPPRALIRFLRMTGSSGIAWEDGHLALSMSYSSSASFSPEHTPPHHHSRRHRHGTVVAASWSWSFFEDTDHLCFFFSWTHPPHHHHRRHHHGIVVAASWSWSFFWRRWSPPSSNIFIVSSRRWSCFFSSFTTESIEANAQSI